MALRLRFSIVGLLVLTLFVALVASNVVTYRRLRQVEPALEKLRNEVGELTVNDPDRVHVIAIPSFEDTTYRWRVHLPKGRRYTLHAGIGQIPEKGLPAGGSANKLKTHSYNPSLADAPFIQTLALNRDQRGGWRLVVDDARRQNTFKLPDNFNPWLEDVSGKTWFVEGKGKTISVPKGEPMVLYRVRKSKQLPGGGVTVEPQPTDGVVVWIEENSKP